MTGVILPDDGEELFPDVETNIDKINKLIDKIMGMFDDLPGMGNAFGAATSIRCAIAAEADTEARWAG